MVVQLFLATRIGRRELPMGKGEAAASTDPGSKPGPDTKAKDTNNEEVQEGEKVKESEEEKKEGEDKEEEGKEEEDKAKNNKGEFFFF